METIDASAMSRPRTDARRKIGSPIFYFNTPEAWGGQALMLDAESKWPRQSAPDYADLQRHTPHRLWVIAVFSSPGPITPGMPPRQRSVPPAPCAGSLSWRPQPPHTADDLARVR